MIFIVEALLAGIIAGCSCFFPVSSMGCVVLFTHFLGFNESFLFYEMLLLGMILASVSLNYKDILRIFISLLEIIRDLFFNLGLYLRQRNDRELNYRRLLTSNYQNFTVIILVSMIPVIILGLLLNPFVRFAYNNELAAAMGFMLTALLLMVSSFVNTGDKNPKKTRTSDAVVIGVMEGFSFIPGVSKTAMGISAGYFLGLSRKMTIKYTYIISMLCMLALLIPGRLSFSYMGGLETADLRMCIFAFLGAFISGFFMIRYSRDHIIKNNNKVYALVNLGFALIAACVYLITG